MKTALETTSEFTPDDDQIEHNFMEGPENAVSRQGKSISDTLRWAMHMPTALGFLGKFRTESQGKNEGRFNIKTHGIDPLVASVWAFAVSKGIVENNTLKCIFFLRMRRIISADMERELASAYECFMEYLLKQGACGRCGSGAGWVHPSILEPYEYAQIHEAMKTVERFQKHIYEDGKGQRPGNTIAFTGSMRKRTRVADLSEHDIQ